jgi:hypothetical protein
MKAGLLTTLLERIGEANSEGRGRKQPVNLLDKPEDFVCNIRL